MANKSAFEVDLKRHVRGSVLPEGGCDTRRLTGRPWEQVSPLEVAWLLNEVCNTTRRRHLTENSEGSSKVLDYLVWTFLQECG